MPSLLHLLCLPTLWISLAPTAAADPVSDLAPGPQELNESQRELTERLAVSEAIGISVARIQSTLMSTPAFDDICSDPLRGPLTLKLRLFATAWHNAAQRVRVQADRVARLSNNPTITPIIDEDRRIVIDSLLARAGEQEASWLELVAWIDSERPAQCALSLVTSSGLPDPIVHAANETQGAVAVLSRIPGYICTEGAKEGVRSDDLVVIVEGPACWSEQQWCACNPTTLDPAAVLGP